MANEEMIDLIVFNSSQMESAQCPRANIKKQTLSTRLDDQAGRGMLLDGNGCASSEMDDFHVRYVGVMDIKAIKIESNDVTQSALDSSKDSDFDCSMNSCVN
jgi:hypothetical protein